MSSLPPPPSHHPPAYGTAGPYGVAAGGAWPPMQSLRGLSTALMVLFACLTVLAVVATGSLFSRAALIDRIVTSDPPSFTEVDDADDRVAAVVGGFVLFALATAVVFIIWQFRHAKNAQVLGGRSGLGPGWAIGGWFIPVASLVLPAVQLFQSSRPSDVRRRGAGIVIVWWLALVLGSVLFVVGGGLNDTDEEGNIVIEGREDIETAADSDRTSGVGLGALGVAAVVGAVMVRQLSARQAAAYERPLPTGTSGAPPPAPWVPAPPGSTQPGWQPAPAPPPPHAPPPPPPAPGGPSWPPPPD